MEFVKNVLRAISPFKGSRDDDDAPATAGALNGLAAAAKKPAAAAPAPTRSSARQAAKAKAPAKRARGAISQPDSARNAFISDARSAIHGIGHCRGHKARPMRRKTAKTCNANAGDLCHRQMHRKRAGGGAGPQPFRPFDKADRRGKRLFEAQFDRVFGPAQAIEVAMPDVGHAVRIFLDQSVGRRRHILDATDLAQPRAPRPPREHLREGRGGEGGNGRWGARARERG